MFGSEILDIAIGMSLLFLFMSLMATSLREIIEAWMKTRGSDLEKGILQILADPNTVKNFYEHPIVASLYKGNYTAGSKDLPSYIPKQHFSTVVLDLLAKASETGSALTLERIKTSLAASGGGANPIQRIAMLAVSEAGDDLDKVKATLEKYFDSTMERVGGWYKRRTAWCLFWIGLGASVFFNVDAITVAQHLMTDKALRNSVVAIAEKQTPPATGKPEENAAAAIQTFKTQKESFEAIGFPIGWKFDGNMPYLAPQYCTTSNGQETCKGFGFNFINVLFGWLITACAVMLGAPFWFDVLSKFMAVRSTLKPKEPEPTKAEEAADNATKKATPATADGGDLGDAANLAVASTTAIQALNDNAFAPHEWTHQQDKNGGLL